MKKRPSARSGASRGSSELGLCACGLPAINKNLKCVGCLREANKRYLATKPPSRVCACGKRVQVARQCRACYQRGYPEEWRQRLAKRRKQDAARRMQNSGVAVSSRTLCSCGEPVYIANMCANCFAGRADDMDVTLVQEAEERRRSQPCTTGKPTGLEPALQLLVLPQKTRYLRMHSPQRMCRHGIADSAFKVSMCRARRTNTQTLMTVGGNYICRHMGLLR